MDSITPSMTSNPVGGLLADGDGEILANVITQLADAQAFLQTAAVPVSKFAPAILCDNDAEVDQIAAGIGVQPEWNEKHTLQFSVIDTERGSASKYVGPFKFQRLNMYEYDPRDLIKAIAAADRRGFPCLVIDSLSRFWSGKGGMLEFVDNSAKRNYGGNNFGGWKDARPIENDMIEAMLGYSGHLIVTMRTKTAYEVTRNDKGQVVPVKIGLQPEQRGGIEYEFDIVGDMDIDNNLTVSKTRCPDLTGKVYNRPGQNVAETILAWLNDGVEGTSANDYRDRALDPSLSFADLGNLKQEVRATGKLGAMVQDDHGDVVTLAALINRKGGEAKAGEQAAPAARPAAPPSQERPAQRAYAQAAAQAEPAPAVDVEREAKWVSDFDARLAESKTEMDYRKRRSEIELAAAKFDISRRAADDLLAVIDVRETPAPDTAEADAA